MTKPWENYEVVIKELYAKHTLDTVRQIMQEKYDFKASVRAYRQKLDAWDCTKYKKREGKSSGDKKDGSSGSKSSTSNSSSSKTSFQFQGQTTPTQQSSQDFDTSTALPGDILWTSAPEHGYTTATSWEPEIKYSPSQASSMVASSYGYPSVGSSGYSNNSGIWYPLDTGYYSADGGWDIPTSNAPPDPMTYPATAATGIDEEDEDEYEDVLSGRSSNRS